MHRRGIEQVEYEHEHAGEQDERGEPGDFQVRVRKNPRYVLEDKCVACGTCAKAGCPATIKIDEVNPKTKMKKAGIDPVLCIGCDICRQVCPTGAIQKPE